MMNLDIDRKYLWHPYGSSKTPAPVLGAVSANGTKIRLENGQELIDGISSWWCMAFGHNPREITEAIRKQSEVMPHVMFAGFTHEPAIRMAEEMVKLLPAGVNKIFLADSGSVAVECAAKMAIQYQHAAGHPKKCRMSALKGGYHGDTTGAMALSDPNGMHAMFHGILPKHFFAERPAIPFGGNWLDADFESMETILEQHGHELAAVIAEPVFQGGNGMWLYHAEYLKKLRAACTAHGVLLILDEIATGFGRTGLRFGADHAGVVPDILCVGKALTGGTITLAAAIASEAVADTIPAFLHGPTFMANPMACSAAAAAMRLYQSRDWLSQVKRIETTLKAALAPCAGMDNVRDVRCLGAIGVLEVDHLPTPEQVRDTVLETGVWLRPFGNYIYTMPPYITTDAELEQIASAMKRLAVQGQKNIHSK